MLIFLKLSLLTCLFFIFLEDFKERLVHVLFYIGTLFISLVIFLIEDQTNNFDLVKSLLFLITVLLLLIIYTKVRGIELPKDVSMGGIALGDIFFIIAIIPLFNTMSYMLFFIMGILLSVIVHLVVYKLKINEEESVPLAGYLAAVLLILISIEIIFEINIRGSIALAG